VTLLSIIPTVPLCLVKPFRGTLCELLAREMRDGQLRKLCTEPFIYQGYMSYSLQRTELDVA
jgi:hypothetical protein